MLSKRGKILIVAFAVPVFFLLAGLIFLTFGDPERYRRPLESWVGEAIGRELKINGRFELDLPFSPRLVAEEVTLAGPEWSDDPLMVRIERLELEIDAWSLVSRPVRVRKVEIHGARVRLERDADGRASWDLAPEKEKDEKLSDLRNPSILWESIRLDDIELTYRRPSPEAPLVCEVERLEAGLDSEGLFAVDFAGSFDSVPVNMKGRITPLHRLLNGEPWMHELEGRASWGELTTRGHVAEVATLEGIDIELETSGPDLETITRLFDLPSLGSGRFELTGSAKSSPQGVDLVLNADLVELQVDACGHVDSMVEPSNVELLWDASGANLHAATALVGWNRAPEGAFEISGRLSGDGNRTTLDHLEGRVGNNRLSVEGVIRAASSIVDRELKFVMDGPDLSEFSAVAGARLPSRSFRLAGHLVRKGERIEVASLGGTLGVIDLEATGSIDEAFRFGGAVLDFRLAGAELTAIRSLAGIDLPAGAFELKGHLASEPSRLFLRNVAGHVGETILEVDGELAMDAGFVGTDLQARVAGSDPSWWTPLTGVEGLPVEPYEVAGRIRIQDDGYELGAVSGSYGSNTFGIDGHLGGPTTSDATELRIQIAGPDLSWFAPVSGVDDLPEEPFDVALGIRTLQFGYGLDSFDGSVGDIDIVAHGKLGELPRIDDSDLQFDIRGPELSALSRYVDVPHLPAERFTVSGRLRAESGVYRLKGVAGELARHRFALEGTVVPQAAGVGTELTLELAGQNLADAARIAREAGVEELADLPDASYSVTGHVRVAESGYEIERFVARVSDAEVRAEGVVGPLPDGLGTDLRIDAGGPDASILPAINGKPLPQEPFSMRGRFEKRQGESRFQNVEVELGEYRVAVDGSLGDPPTLAGTNLDLRAAGPDLSLIFELADLSLPSGDPFEVTAHFDGSPENFAMRRFHANDGKSDLGGSFRVDLRGVRPEVQGEFFSERIDLGELRDEDDPRGGGEDSGMLFSDEPLDLEFLHELEAHVRWRVGELDDRYGQLSNIELEFEIADGHLRLSRARADAHDGTYSATLDIAPVGEEYRMELHGRADQAHWSLVAFSGDPGEIAPMDLELDLIGTGRSLHSIAASANGRVRLVQGSGKIDNLALGGTAHEGLSELYRSLNPFTKKEKYTRLECSVVFVEIEDGIARLGPMAMRTDKMVMLGEGQVNLETEKLDLQWVTKPRRGVGLSASAITNSYIKLGGTLSQPKLSMTPLKAARDTGLAVFTGGLSILGRVVFNRVTAERNVCRLAIESAEKRARKSRGE